MVSTPPSPRAFCTHVALAEGWKAAQDIQDFELRVLLGSSIRRENSFVGMVKRGGGKKGAQCFLPLSTAISTHRGPSHSLMPSSQAQTQQWLGQHPPRIAENSYESSTTLKCQLICQANLHFCKEIVVPTTELTLPHRPKHAWRDMTHKSECVRTWLGRSRGFLIVSDRVRGPGFKQNQCNVTHVRENSKEAAICLRVQ